MLSFTASSRHHDTHKTDIQNRLLKNSLTSSVHFEAPGAQALEVSDFRNKAAK